VTCVEWWHTQQLVGQRAATALSPRGVLQLSGRIVYDAHKRVVCFLLDDVDGCMDGFREVWESVSKIMDIACEGMSAFPLPFLG
jgi:mediator of RNA polymerase II transcription subunit 14